MAHLEARDEFFAFDGVLGQAGDGPPPTPALNEPVADRDPVRYHIGMSKQIAVRLPEDLVEYVDGQVRSGAVTSRADAVAQALARERRRTRAAQDLAILLAERDVEDPDRLDDLAEFARTVPID
jgi:Arc/MetJ-type ribon-helix-helix transcriptional regulator